MENFFYIILNVFCIEINYFKIYSPYLDCLVMVKLMSNISYWMSLILIGILVNVKKLSVINFFYNYFYC